MLETEHRTLGERQEQAKGQARSNVRVLCLLQMEARLQSPVPHHEDGGHGNADGQ